VRDDGRARVLEWLASSDVIVMMMAVDQVLDRLVGNLSDLGDVVLAAGRPAQCDRIGRDHTIFGDDEHRLMIAGAEDGDVLGTLDLGRFDLRPLCLCACGQNADNQYGSRRYEINSRHARSLPFVLDRTCLALRGPETHYN